MQTNHPPSQQGNNSNSKQSNSDPLLFDWDEWAEKTTSQLARESAKPKRQTRCSQVIDSITSAGGRGLTRDELSVTLKLPIQSICPLVKTLLTAGRIRETPQKRPTRSGRDAYVLVMACTPMDRKK